MKKSFRFSLMTVSGLLAVAVLFTACSKFDDDNNSNNPAAALMSFNLAPDQPSVAITLSGNSISNQPLAYTNYSGTYQLVYPGNRRVESFYAPSDSSLDAVDYTFVTDKYYSLFVTGANGNYSNVITNDNFDSLKATTGKAFVRYINAIPDSTKPVVTIAAGNTNVINDNASFNNISEFKAIDAGNVTINVNNGTTINNVNRTIALEQNKVYTVLLVGIPGATDAAKAVQIKYITNGNITNSQ
jgi:hypothetical protein